MPSRFEVDYNDPALAFEPLVDEVFSELKSSFLEMPRGDGFIDYATFEQGYQILKRTTDAFTIVSPATVEAAVSAVPISFIVFRAILGFTPPQDSYLDESVYMGFSQRWDPRLTKELPRSKNP